MNENITCCNCMYGYNEDWNVKVVKNKIIICPKCKNKLKFDDDLNLVELGFGDKLSIKEVYERLSNE